MMDVGTYIERDLEAMKAEELSKNVARSSMALLPSLPAGFYIPLLPDRPQNPIMDNIKQPRKSSIEGAEELQNLPPELRLLTLDQGLTRFDEFQRQSEELDIWKEALTRNRGLKNCAFNWDSLHHGQYKEASTSKFISEQDPFVVATARQQAKAHPDAVSADLVYASKHKLFNALKLTILGAASVFHTWDETLELFVQSDSNAGKAAGVLIDGMDKTISESVIARFLKIGTLLRRLEVFVDRLRKSSATHGPTVFAFAHALSTVISLLRKDLAKGPPTPTAPLIPESELAATWMHYEIYEQTLVALSLMCGCPAEKAPKQYTRFDVDHAALLNLVYSHVNKHICGKSPRFLTAIFAFILTTVSEDYFHKLSHSIGYHTDAHHQHGAHKKSDVYLVDDGYELDASDDEDEDASGPSWDHFPELLPPELLDILPAAQKSLTLLKAAQPDHPLLNDTSQHTRIRWIWRHDGIMKAWEGSPGDAHPEDYGVANVSSNGASSPEADHFALFRDFELEPGQKASPSSSVVDSSALLTLETFIHTFPESLPPITPDLSHLTSLVMAPLVEHASTLASALLTLFLTSADNLNFRSHLVLLRSYLLITGTQFRSRLSSALFSDSEDTHSDETTQQMSIKYLKRKAKGSSSGEANGRSTTWAMGLSPSLLERGEWPPVDADVRFFLRTVIVDSLDEEKEALEGMGLSAEVTREAEYRLGFVPRLPSRESKVKWQDPLVIEALDFVYLTYRPPRPLEVLITPDIVAKYQRLFSFLVRLMRVEHALGSLFRITRKHSHQLFPTLADTQRLLLHFRFVAQSFVSNLARYVFDTAIGGNFDPFYESLSATSEETSRRNPSRYTDVFSLANSHSEMLDNILSACMLRKAQQGMLDVLRALLQTILDFCIKAGMSYRGQLEEYQAAPMLEEISQKFHTRMTFFVRNLRKIMEMDKDPTVSTSTLHNPTGDVQETVGGAEALRHLLIRLDLGKWWLTSK